MAKEVAGLIKLQITYAGICTYAFYLLVVPEWEGIVITIGEDDRVAFLLERHQIVLAEVAAGVTS